MVEVSDQLHGLDGRCSLSVNLPGVMSQLLPDEVVHSLALMGGSPNVQCSRMCNQFVCPSRLVDQKLMCPLTYKHPGNICLPKGDFVMHPMLKG